MNKSIFAGLLSVLALMMLSGCSKKSDNLYDCVPGDAMLVMSGSPAETFKNAGCTPTATGFEVSDALARIMASFPNDERESITELLDGAGIDFDRAVTVVDPARAHYFITFALDNEDDFAKWCEKQDLKMYSSGGYSVYSPNSNISIAVKDSQAWVIIGDHSGKEAEYINAFYSAAKEAPLPSWIREKIDNAEALGVSLNISKYSEYVASRSFAALPPALEGAMWQGYDTEALTNGYFVYDCGFDGIAIRGKGSFYSADGEKLVNKAKIRPVNTDLLRYAHDDAAVVMLSLPDSADWYNTINILNERLASLGLGIDDHIATMAASVLENVDHTIMLSGGVADLSALNSANGWSGTIAIDFREGKAYEYFEMIRTMADNFGFPSSTVGGDAFSFSIPGSGVTVYVKNEGNALIASLSPTIPGESNRTFVNTFDDTLGGMIIDLAKDNPLVQFVSLPFGLNMAYTATSDDIIIDIAQTGTQGLMLDNFIKYFAERTAK